MEINALELMTDLLKNPIFLSTVLAWASAQIIKALLLLIQGERDFSRLLSGGGMPSSHTATVFGLLMSTILWCGTGGFEVPMATFFMIMIVYDSVNVRYVTGEQNKVINHLIRRGHAEKDPFYDDKTDDRKELMGHTVPEVIAGAVLGILIPILLNALTHGTLTIH